MRGGVVIVSELCPCFDFYVLSYFCVKHFELPLCMKLQGLETQHLTAECVFTNSLVWGGKKEENRRTPTVF